MDNLYLRSVVITLENLWDLTMDVETSTPLQRALNNLQPLVLLHVLTSDLELTLLKSNFIHQVYLEDRCMALAPINFLCSPSAVGLVLPPSSF